MAACYDALIMELIAVDRTVYYDRQPFPAAPCEGLMVAAGWSTTASTRARDAATPRLFCCYLGGGAEFAQALPWRKL